MDIRNTSHYALGSGLLKLYLSLSKYGFSGLGFFQEDGMIDILETWRSKHVRNSFYMIVQVCGVCISDFFWNVCQNAFLPTFISLIGLFPKFIFYAISIHAL